MIKDLILRRCFTNFQDAWSLKPGKGQDESYIFEKFANYIILSQDEVNTFVGHPELLEFCSTGGIVEGIEIKMEVTVGQKVIIRDYAGTTVKLDGEEVIIVRQDDILAIVE